MILRVQLFALARQLAEAEFIELTLVEGTTVGEVRHALEKSRPELAHLLPHVLFAINSEYAGDENAIPLGASIACIPPVSGG